MQTSDQKAREILRQLSNQLARGLAALLVAKHINSAQSAGRLNCAHYFFTAIYESCIQHALLTLSKVAVCHPRSITIWHLLTFAESNYFVFAVDELTMLDRVALHKQRLRQMKPLVDNVKEQRDRILAHLDRSHVYNPSAVYTYPPLDYNEVESALRKLLCMVNVYYRCLSPSTEFRIDNIESGIADDFKYLVRLVEQDNAES